jgi:hypothetical protein
MLKEMKESIATYRRKCSGDDAWQIVEDFHDHRATRFANEDNDRDKKSDEYSATEEDRDE